MKKVNFEKVQLLTIFTIFSKFEKILGKISEKVKKEQKFVYYSRNFKAW